MSALSRIAAATGLAALAFAAGLPSALADPSSPQSRGGSCFYLSQLKSLKADGPRTLYAIIDGRTVFRIDLDNDCSGLADGTDTAVIQPLSSNNICSALAMNISIRDTGQRCMARTMTRLTADEIAALPKSARP